MPLSERAYMRPDHPVRLESLDETPRGSPPRPPSRFRRRRPPRGVSIGYVLSLALLLPLTVAHAGVWTSPFARLQYATILDACPSFDPAALAYDEIWLLFAADAAAFALAAGFRDATLRRRPWPWTTMLWALLGAAAACLAHALAGVPVDFLR